MRIFVIPSVFPSKINPNSGSFILEQCKALSSAGYKVVVLYVETLRYKNWVNKKNVAQNYSIDNIEILYSNYCGLASNKYPNYAINKYNNKLFKLFHDALKKYGPPNFMHAHFTFTAGIGTYELHKMTGIPFIVTEHSSLYFDHKLNKTIIKNLSIVIENAFSFLAVSEILRESIKYFIGSNYEIGIIKNMLDDSFKFYPKVSLNDTKFTFFSAGNLVKNKNFQMLIDSFCQEFNEDEKVILRICGNGPERKSLETSVKRYKRSHQISFLGYLNRDEILNQYISCNCFVLTSLYETFGIVYREALAVGRPIISSKNGGILEGWDEDFGILIDNNDVASCKLALRQMYTHINSYNGKLMSEKIRTKYSKEVLIEKINEISSRITS